VVRAFNGPAEQRARAARRPSAIRSETRGLQPLLPLLATAVSTRLSTSSNLCGELLSKGSAFVTNDKQRPVAVDGFLATRSSGSYALSQRSYCHGGSVGLVPPFLGRKII
jgi:hypothetical protein